jgi:hypothetical protein
MTKARGSFELKAWNEDAYEELGDGRKLTRAEVAQVFTGDISGEGAVQWLMYYREDGTARFLGLQRVNGSIGDRSGSFVLETVGDFDGGEARGAWTVVPGSGTEGLSGLSGKGKFSAPRGPQAEYELTYDLS